MKSLAWASMQRELSLSLSLFVIGEKLFVNFIAKKQMYRYLRRISDPFLFFHQHEPYISIINCCSSEKKFIGVQKLEMDLFMCIRKGSSLKGCHIFKCIRIFKISHCMWNTSRSRLNASHFILKHIPFKKLELFQSDIQSECKNDKKEGILKVRLEKELIY